MNIFRLMMSSVILMLSGSVTASIELPTLSIMLAQHCQTIGCIRSNIDLIDSQIVKLIGLRLTYVKRAGELKKDKKAIHDQVRENQILLNLATQAQKIGYPSFIVTEIYKTVLAQSNIYEKIINRQGR